MATTAKISIKPPEVSVFENSKIDSDAALKASEVLQENHELRHIFFSAWGLHVRLTNLKIHGSSFQPRTTSYITSSLYLLLVQHRRNRTALLDK